MTDEIGPSVIITGGASGIGAATARRIVAGGGHVGLVDIDENRAQALVDEITKRLLEHIRAGARVRLT